MEANGVERGRKEQKGNTGTGHLAWLDVLRAMATVSVVCVHVFSLAAAQLLPGCMPFRILDALTFTFLMCNPLFLMISGALLLPVSGERAVAFYAKRFTKAAIPLAVYYILYVCAKEGLSWLYPVNWFPMLQRILAGEPYEAPHFWLVYVILELYVLTPFLRGILQHIPDSVSVGVTAVIFAVNAFDLYFPLYGRSSFLSRIVDTSAGVFILGYVLSEKCDKRLERFLISGGVVSYALSVFRILYTDTYRILFNQNAPAVMLFSAAVFLTVRRMNEGKRSARFPVRLLSKYSYSILLIHWGTLHFAVKKVLKVDVMSGGIVGGCLLAVVLTLLISAAGAIVVDHLLIFPLQAFWRKAWAALAGKRRRADG